MDYDGLNPDSDKSSQICNLLLIIMFIVILITVVFILKADSPAHLIEKILIGGQDDSDNKVDLENHSIFSELSVLHIFNGNYVWKETARFDK
jgi:hypothetical protein